MRIKGVAVMLIVAVPMPAMVVVTMVVFGMIVPVIMTFGFFGMSVPVIAMVVCMSVVMLTMIVRVPGSPFADFEQLYSCSLRQFNSLGAMGKGLQRSA